MTPVSSVVERHKWIVTLQAGKWFQRHEDGELLKGAEDGAAKWPGKNQGCCHSGGKPRVHLEKGRSLPAAKRGVSGRGRCAHRRAR